MSSLPSGAYRGNAAASKAQEIFWSLGGGPADAQIQLAQSPLRNRSKVTTIYANPRNLLDESSGIWLDRSGKRIWILTLGKTRYDPGDVEVFDLPLTQLSAPVHRFVLSGTDFPLYLAFDAAGHLWVNSRYTNTVLEYTGPFDGNGTLSPHAKLSQGLNQPNGIAFDSHGNLYVANFGSKGSHSIAVYRAPVTNRKPYFLNGLVYPGGLAFDKDGNLYGSSNSPSASAIVRYASDDLKSGSYPSVVDRSGLLHTYGTTFAFSASGDLYVTNCGVGASILVYPTGEKPFTPLLEPSLQYRNYEIQETGCVWGIAIH